MRWHGQEQGQHRCAPRKREEKDNYLVRVLLLLRTSFPCVWGVTCAREKSERRANQSKEGKATRNGSERSSHRLDVPAVNVNWAEVLEDIDFHTKGKLERSMVKRGVSAQRKVVEKSFSQFRSLRFPMPGLGGVTRAESRPLMVSATVSDSCFCLLAR